MLGIFIWLKNLWRKTTLIHLKIALFTLICTGVFLDITLKIDLQEKIIDYKNGSTSLPVIAMLIIASLIIIIFDFWVEKVRMKQRTQNDIINLLKENKFSEKFQIEALKLLREKT